MKHDYTDETIQDAIDEACKETQKTNFAVIGKTIIMTPTVYPETWSEEAPARLTLARELLERLPEPTPPVAEIPWTEWHGGECPLRDDEVEEWEFEYRDGDRTNALTPSKFVWTQNGSIDDIIAYRVLKKKKPKPQDPYAELKKAHAEGKVIEWRTKVRGEWIGWKAVDFPAWYPAPCDEYRIKPAPKTFEAHGKVWQRHTPGDPMPCEGARRIYCWDDLGRSGPFSAQSYDWSATRNETLGGNITGWRYADEPTPEATKTSPPTYVGYMTDEAPAPTPAATQPAPAWQPAVGDTVRLKSGGPVMTVDAIVDDTVNCEWHTTDGMPQCRHYYPACLEPATKEDAQ